MKNIAFAPGAVVSPGAITIPTNAPDIGSIVSAQIIRTTSGITISAHAVTQPTQADHSHSLMSTGIGGAVAEALGLPAGLNVLNDAGAAGTHTIPNADGTNGVQKTGAPPVISGTAVAAHTLTGADPTVAATPTKLTSRTLSLNVNTVLGDLLLLYYEAVGEVVLVQ